MIDMKKVLKGTLYEDKAQLVTNTLERAGYHRLQDLPALGLTGVDVYDLLAVINGRTAELEQVEKEKVAVAEEKKRTAKVIKPDNKSEKEA
jgi:hypothetical protein